MSVTNSANPQKNPSPPRREQADFPPQPQSQPQLEQGDMPRQAGGAQDPQPVGAAYTNDEETFEVSMDDWFKA